jgi:hypothetical protein
LENIALRHQLAVFTREKKRPRLRDRDRLFWIALKKLYKDWRAALAFVQPETVIGWQRKRFKRLVEIVPAEKARAPATEFGDPLVDPNDGCRQSHLGSAAHPWRIAEAWV